MPALPPPFSRSFLKRAGHAALPLLLVGCTHASAQVSAKSATQSFSTEHSCPTWRISAIREATSPPPSGEIARDPERMQLWVDADARRDELSAHDIVTVAGCGHRKRYSCWRLRSRVPNRGGYGYVWTDAACTPEGAEPNRETAFVLPPREE